jgi:carboxypeptidase C (cathepsin A)
MVKFPNLIKNDFYISGESYAGVYVPYLALEIIKYNKLTNKRLKFNLKGILVGNACTDPR